MLINRDYVAHMASEVVKRLIEGNQIETKAAEAVIPRVRAKMMEEITVEDRLNDEVRDILTQHQDEMRRTGGSYQEMYKKVKGQLARDRKLVLRSRRPLLHATQPRKNHSALPSDYGSACFERRSGIRRRPRHDSAAG